MTASVGDHFSYEICKKQTNNLCVGFIDLLSSRKGFHNALKQEKQSCGGQAGRTLGHHCRLTTCSCSLPKALPPPLPHPLLASPAGWMDSIETGNSAADNHDCVCYRKLKGKPSVKIQNFSLVPQQTSLYLWNFIQQMFSGLPLGRLTLYRPSLLIMEAF